MASPPSSKALPKGVLLLSLASLFTDVASEAVYPILPIFLTATLGASPFSLGLIEGIAESTASLLKAFFGAKSDRIGKKKPFVIFGYGISNLVKPFIALVGSWPQVLLIRFLDRTGKGMRTAPRDAWLANLGEESQYARIYGFHRGMDHAGAVLGPLLASLYLYFYPQSMRTLFLLTIIPGVIAVVLLGFIPESHTTAPNGTSLIKYRQAWRELSPELKKYFLILFLFSLGNSTDAFLLLRLKEGGVPQAFIPALWAVLHIVKMATSFYSSRISKHLGLKNTIFLGWLLYALAYFSFALPLDRSAMICIFLSYGLYFGLTEGPERALVATLSPPHLKGSHFGIYAMTVGLSTLPASLIFGFLWGWGGMKLAFLTGAGLAATASLLLYLGIRQRQEPVLGRIPTPKNDSD